METMKVHPPRSTYTAIRCVGDESSHTNASRLLLGERPDNSVSMSPMSLTAMSQDRYTYLKLTPCTSPSTL
jgi:hypothetical protein